MRYGQANKPEIPDEEKGTINMANLLDKYTEWRKISEEMLEDGHAGSVDCGEAVVREDFSAFAGLSDVITYEEMLEIEREYEESAGK